MGTKANSEDKSAMPHIVAYYLGSTVCDKTRLIIRERNTIYFLEIIIFEPSIGLDKHKISA